MAMSTPYPGISPPYYGNLTETQDDLNAWVERVHRAGIQVNCHANGDVAIDQVLTAVGARAQGSIPAPGRAAQDHPLQPDQRQTWCAASRRMDAVPAVFTTYAYYNSDKFHFYGEDMMKHMHGLPHLARRRHRAWPPARISAPAPSRR